MRIKFDLNGKALLGIAFLSAGLAFGDFVTIVDSKSSGGITVEGMTDAEVKAIVLETMPIGSITMRMDNIDPTTIYGGTWEIIEADASLHSGGGGSLSGLVVGENEMDVPLKNHSHSTTVSSNTHHHQFSGPSQSYAGITSGSDTRRYSETGAEKRIYVNTTSDTHSHTVTVGSEGIVSPKIDVRGARVLINVWKRIG